MEPTMYYVYSLVVDGSVFYIGKSKELSARYAAHLNSYKKAHPTPVSIYISKLLKLGKCPEMRIIAYLPEREAAQKEIDLISLFIRAGQDIVNGTHCWMKQHSPDKIPVIPTKRNMIKWLKYRQGEIAYMAAWWKDNHTEVECPDNPFKANN